MLFLVSFFSITRLENDILRFFVYFVVMVLLFALVYRKNLKTYISQFNDTCAKQYTTDINLSSRLFYELKVIAKAFF